ncbi:hypothetical protein E2C01_080600 [Portunus trituberculatus]|uniref:Uncharacterized protein n=1 Tax=Portunus trituberculatus TaxID=210409 RepID=A0A5B7J012_PORTR|nr:hypothetical protein [Portunus trituberculatus]
MALGKCCYKIRRSISVARITRQMTIHRLNSVATTGLIDCCLPRKRQATLPHHTIALYLHSHHTLYTHRITQPYTYIYSSPQTQLDIHFNSFFLCKRGKLTKTN